MIYLTYLNYLFTLIAADMSFRKRDLLIIGIALSICDLLLLLTALILYSEDEKNNDVYYSYNHLSIQYTLTGVKIIIAAALYALSLAFLIKILFHHAYETVRSDFVSYLKFTLCIIQIAAYIYSILSIIDTCNYKDSCLDRVTPLYL